MRINKRSIFMCIVVVGCHAGSTGDGVPPTGDYTVKARMLADGCATRSVPPEPWEVEVVRTAVDGRVTVHLPLSWSPPESDTEVGYEIDVVLIPAEPQTRRPPRAFEAGCGAEEQRVAPMAVSRTGFTLTIETVYGERSMMCKDTLPEHCTTKVEQVYTQVKF